MTAIRATTMIAAALIVLPDCCRSSGSIAAACREMASALQRALETTANGQAR